MHLTASPCPSYPTPHVTVLLCRVLVEIQPVACVVDESLAEASSSSSSDEEDGGQEEGGTAAQRRAQRRAAAAAALPAGSSMPGWIGRLQQCGSSGGGGRLWSPGRLCKVHACVPLQHAGEAEGDAAAAAAGLQSAVRRATDELAAGLAAAELAVDDVAACKAYCLASLLSADGGGLSAAALREAVAAGLPGVQPAVVPVSAVGSSADFSSGAAVMLELLAVRS